ncbi:MAG TPA: thiamine phosphate synthase [Deltaproteobacteria bacterium]|nr:thiamine phosphate synthase [Deltaproteobacteria bacterium]HCP44501.1 thiamine phosphate synthase [Deltaproteobacteria bacterium]
MVDTSPRPNRSHLDLASALLDGGSRVLQLRMKEAPANEQAELLSALLPLCQSRRAELVVNDSIALAARFAGVGVHLGQDDADPREARQVLGPQVLIGHSTHSPSQAKAAEDLGVDYIGFGPIFSSGSKHLAEGDRRSPDLPVGLATLKQVVGDATVSVVAIGGIDMDNLPLVLATGVPAVAVISAVVTADNMLESARSFHRSIQGN